MSEEINLIPTPLIRDITDLDQNLKEWIRIGELIKDYEDLLKELKEKRAKLQEKNIEFMKINELDYVSLGNTKKIALVETRNKVSNITKSRLPTKLSEYFMKNHDYGEEESRVLTDEIMDFLETDPVYTTNMYLKKYEKD